MKSRVTFSELIKKNGRSTKEKKISDILGNNKNKSSIRALLHFVLMFSELTKKMGEAKEKIPNLLGNKKQMILKSFDTFCYVMSVFF